MAVTGFSAVRRRAAGRTMVRGGPVAVVLALGAVALGPAGSAGAASVVAVWNMNETAGSKVLVDSGPNHINGTIGTSITLNGSFHSFPQVQRGFNNATFDPQHLDVINDPRMNPGTADFSVTARIKIAKPSDAFGNVMQKGQSGSPTGFWKMELDGPTRGLVFCGFRSVVNGVTTQGGIRSPINIADNQWHVVTCERGPGFVSTTVDGHTTKQMHFVGNVVNNVPLTIGGKLNCTAATLHHDCDYFEGQLDYVQIQTG
jgi:Concanavalin A-like lectin/glucanases superfamily